MVRIVRLVMIVGLVELVLLVYLSALSFLPRSFRPPITGYTKKDIAEIEGMLKALI